MTAPRWEIDALTGDVICQHGVAADVHCCNCHSGFLFGACECEAEDEGDDEQARTE